MNLLTFTILLLLLTVECILATGEDGGHEYTKRESEILDRLIMMERYDPRVRPTNAEGDPTYVTCSFYISSFGELDEMRMDYSISIFLRTKWRDERLHHQGINGNNRSLIIMGDMTRQVWRPDIYFPDEKNAKFHDVTQPNTRIQIDASGEIHYTARMTLTLSCPMILTHFPLDRQTCKLAMESFGYSERDLRLQWLAENPVEKKRGLELPQFELSDDMPIDTGMINYTTVYERTCRDCTVSSRLDLSLNHLDENAMPSGTIPDSFQLTPDPPSHTSFTGNYSRLTVTFHLARKFGFFLLQTYIPSVLIVVLSWVSFWIHADAVPARISLGVTTVLTMTTQLTGSRGSMPKVSYPKAMDVWMAVCMIFVFAAIIEYAIVNVFVRTKSPSTASSADSSPKKFSHNDDPDKDEDEESEEYSKLEVCCRRMTEFFSRPRRRNIAQRNVAKAIDQFSRVGFPTAFFIFNILYWSIYASYSPPVN